MHVFAVALIGLAVVPLYSQEALSSAEFRRADVVVVGTLSRDFKFPWFDGWNERGHIQVERVLKGQLGEARVLPFAWERDFRRGWCMTRPDWRGVIGKRGIWVLKRNGSQYRAELFGGFIGAEQVAEVVRLLAQPSN